MHGARGHSCNCSRLWSEQPAEWGGPIDGAQRTGQQSQVLDSESDIGCTSLQQSGPIRAQQMKTTTYQPTKTSQTPQATVTAHKARPLPFIPSFQIWQYSCQFGLGPFQVGSVLIWPV